VRRLDGLLLEPLETEDLEPLGDVLEVV